jgi:hypothetical protein
MQMNEVQTLLLRRMKSLNRTEKTAHVEMSVDTTPLEEEDMMGNTEEASMIDDQEQQEMNGHDLEENWDFVEPTEEDLPLLEEEHSTDSDCSEEVDPSTLEEGNNSLCGDRPIQYLPLGDNINNPVCALDEKHRFEYYLQMLSQSKYPIIDTIEVMSRQTPEGRYRI